jgi:hypothetical protein
MGKKTHLKQLIFWIIILILPCLLQAKPYTTTGNEEVGDDLTGLIWLKSWNSDWSTNRVDWHGAMNYCENLNFANASDWRVPNIKELSSIISRTHTNPAIDNVAFNWGDHQSIYWSSTPHYGSGANRAWVVNFVEGTVSTESTSCSQCFVKCVRH